MKRFVACVCLLAVGCSRSSAPQRVEVVRTNEPAASAVAVESQAEPIGEPIQPDRFEFSDDAGGRILARILPPSESARLPADANSSPQPRRKLQRLEKPDLPMPVGGLNLPKLPAARHVALRPHLVNDSTPLADFREEIDVPRRPELPVAARIRTSSRDVNEPIELPPQTGYSADRAPLTDPTTEFSAERAIGHSLPMRVTPAPFLRIDLPEPFPNRISVKAVSPEPGLVAPVPMPPK